MDKLLERADPQYRRQCTLFTVRAFYIFMGINLCALTSAIMESLVPLSKSELELRRNIYRTLHPHRRHSAIVYFVLIDESTSPWYEIIYAITVYLIYNEFVPFTTVGVTFVPSIVEQLRVQYEILATFAAQIFLQVPLIFFKWFIYSIVSIKFSF